MNFNCLVVGDKSVGKTSFIDKWKYGTFDFNYVPTDGLNKSKIFMPTSIGEINFNIFDGGYPSKVDCAVIMFDVTNINSLNNVVHYYNWIKSMFGTLPIVVCGNKIDNGKDNCISHKTIYKFLFVDNKTYHFTYFDISAKSNYNFEKPFLFLLRKLFDSNYDHKLLNSNINFVEQ